MSAFDDALAAKIEQAAQVAVDRAFDDGLRTAAQMIREAHERHPQVSVLELAAAIEAVAALPAGAA